MIFSKFGNKVDVLCTANMQVGHLLDSAPFCFFLLDMHKETGEIDIGSAFGDYHGEEYLSEGSTIPSVIKGEVNRADAA